MKIHSGYSELPSAARGAVVAIGNFDGIHLGHRAVISFAQTEARLRDVPSGVLTFDPHPRRFFDPSAPRFELAPLRSKARHLHELGLDNLYVLPFDDRLRSLTAEKFVDDVLVSGLGIKGAVVGKNFRFGTKRQGDTAFLKAQGAIHGFTVDCLAQVDAPQGETYSSSNVRRLLQEGKPRDARLLLGRSWGLHGNIVEQDSWTRSRGFTFALDISEYILPKAGAYMAWVGFEGGTDIEWHPAVAIVRESTGEGRCEPSLALELLELRDGDRKGRVWVSFEEYLDCAFSAPQLAQSGQLQSQPLKQAAEFIHSAAGRASKPPSVSLARARQMTKLERCVA